MVLSVLGLLGTRDVVAADLKQHLIAAIDAPDGRSDGDLEWADDGVLQGADAVACAGAGSGQEH
jgi:hypothetical protein